MVEMMRLAGILLLLFLVGCTTAPELPTLVPTADNPAEPAATNTPLLPPTRDIFQPTSTPPPTSTIAPATPRPTNSPAPVDPAVNITSPSDNAELVMGSQIIAGGFAQLNANQTLTVRLVSVTGLLLAEAGTQAGDINSWQASLAVPQVFSGPARLQATITDADGQVVAEDISEVKLVLETSTTDRYLALFRPLNGENGVAGYNLFFDGRAQRPVNNTVTIAIWQDCQTEVARQSFVLDGSGYWQGYIGVPRDLAGAVCAVASFGVLGEETWRQAAVTMNILAASDENARAVLVGNPPPGSVLTAGESVWISGTAYNAPDSQVVVSIMQENGRVLTEGVAATDLYGYWEIELFIPLDASGPAQINVTIGTPSEDNYAQNQTLVTIEAPES
jgi:hypothetical protein